MANKPKQNPASDNMQYSYLAPDAIEYFSLDDSTVPDNTSDTPLTIRFSIIPSTLLRVLDAEENARFMTADQMRRLTDNVARDDALTSVVCVYPELETKQLAIISGNHRVEAAIQAGQTMIPVLVIQTRLSSERRKALQLSHNAITGQDDPNLLKRLYEDLSLEYKAYSGLTDDYFKSLEKIDIEGLSIGSPQYEEISFLFLPSEKDILLEQLKSLEKAKSKRTVLCAAYEDYSRLFDAIVAVKEFKHVFNNAVAIRLLADLALERLEHIISEIQTTTDHGEQTEILSNPSRASH